MQKVKNQYVVSVVSKYILVRCFGLTSFKVIFNASKNTFPICVNVLCHSYLYFKVLAHKYLLVEFWVDLIATDCLFESYAIVAFSILIMCNK